MVGDCSDWFVSITAAVMFNGLITSAA